MLTLSGGYIADVGQNVGGNFSLAGLGEAGHHVLVPVRVRVRSSSFRRVLTTATCAQSRPFGPDQTPSPRRCRPPFVSLLDHELEIADVPAQRAHQRMFALHSPCKAVRQEDLRRHQIYLHFDRVRFHGCPIVFVNIPGHVAGQQRDGQS